MSEEGEIPFKDSAINEDDDAEEGEVVETAAVVADDGQSGYDDVMARAVVDDNASSSVKPMADKNDTGKEADEFFLPSVNVAKTPGADGYISEPAIPSNKSQKDEREAAEALLAAAPADTKVEEPVAVSATAAEAAQEMLFMAGSATEIAKDNKEMENMESTAEIAKSNAMAEKEQEVAQEMAALASVPGPAEKDGGAKNVEVDDGQVEAGELIDKSNKFAETSKMNSEQISSPMDVDGPKESEGATASDRTSKSNDPDDNGEVKAHADDDIDPKHVGEEGEIEEEDEEESEDKQDETMEDVKGPDAVPDTASGSADVDTATTSDADTASVADDKPSYSTRGRTSGSPTPVPRDVPQMPKSSKETGPAVDGSTSDQWELSAREALEDLSRPKEGIPAGVGTGGTSFLEALGEDERRTRTRFLPAVDGFHQLRKLEVKADLALARSIMTSSGNVASVASIAGTANASIAKKSSKKKKSDGEGDSMDTDEGEALPPVEDASAEVGVRVGNASNIEISAEDVVSVPSTAFIPPPAATQAVSTANGDKKDEGGPPAPVISTGIKEILNNQANIKSPRVVEAVSAFNPPRPPESGGKKKQHRMLRWERRPADVEIDLNNYRKTVDRTRKELHTAEAELERIENTGSHLRRHFLGHLKCIDQETGLILEELGDVQQECVGAADLLTSRTRSRGAGKGSYVMKDVLGVLKTRGVDLHEKGLTIRSDFIADVAQNFPGVGGVSAVSFADWDHGTVIAPHRIASAWILPGDKVQTPCGEGQVVKVFNTSSLDDKQPPLADTVLKPRSSGSSPAKVDVDHSSKHASSSGPNSGDKKKQPLSVLDDSPNDLNAKLAPRVCVRYPFGIGYFSSEAVTSKECANALSDAQLMKRWKGIVDTATMVADQLDPAGMAILDIPVPHDDDNAKSEQQSTKLEEAGSIVGSAMDIEGVINGARGSKTSKDPSKLRLLPFGSGLLPTGTGRASGLAELDVHQLQQGVQPALSNGSGVLGDKANEGVPSDVKKFEEQRQQTYTLQARVFHLRNQLYRQRKIRTLNERTLSTTKERSARVESLVTEMRTDLKSLKNRLDEELKELGIDHDKAESILKEYYLSQEYAVEGEEGADGEDSTQKRTRDDHGAPGESAPVFTDERQAKRNKVSSQ